jgi:glycine betaine transporter
VKNIRHAVFWPPIAMLVALVIVSVIDLPRFLAVATSVNEWILAVFSNWFAIGAFCFVLTIVWAFFSPLGGVRIGGPDAKPILKPWNWFAVTLCTTIAIGLLFWASAEPIYHLYNPGGLSIAPGSEEAGRFALSSLFMHWSFTPYEIYTVPALAFALALHNLGKPFSLAGPLSVFMKRPPSGFVAVLDAAALITILMGLSASLGTGIITISGGLHRLFDSPSSPILMAVIAAAIVSAFVLSSITGVANGIRVLSDINTKFFFLFALLFLLAGPTWSLLQAGVIAACDYVVEFLPRSFVVGEFSNREWANDWTIFYWANWLAWAPITAMFLGQIGRGYTVRAFILANFFLPALFAMIWMTIFGGLAINIDLTTDGALKAVLDQSGPEGVMFAVLDQFPLSHLLAAMLILISFISYVTGADCNLDAIANLCSTDEARQLPSTALLIKVVAGALVGFAAWVMTAFTGIDGIRMLSNWGGLPALFIVIGMNGALIFMGTRQLGTLRSPSL